jgi:YVTN family beta-propeller protein
VRPHLLPAILAAVLAAGIGQAQYLETTIPVGNTPTSILWNPTSNKVYVCNEQSASVTVIDGATNAVLASIPVADYPTFLAWNSADNKVYCASGESDRLTVIDGVGDTVIQSLHVSGFPTIMVYSSIHDKLYVNCYDIGTVLVLDARNDTALRSVATGATAECLLWHPVTDRVLLTHYGGEVVSIDCATDSIVTRLPVGSRPSNMCLSPGREHVYVACRWTTCAVNATGDSVVAQIPGFTSRLCPVPYPDKVYGAGAGVVRVIDCRTQTVVDSLLGGVGGPIEMVCDTNNGRAYCLNLTGSAVEVVEAERDSVTQSIHLGRAPVLMCWNSTDSRIYITDELDDVVYVIRDTSTAVAEERRLPLHVAGAVSVTTRQLTWAGGSAQLLDMSGRTVAALRHGANDVSMLPAGVYVVRAGSGAVIQKVVKVR